MNQSQVKSFGLFIFDLLIIYTLLTITDNKGRFVWKTNFALDVLEDIKDINGSRTHNLI